MFVIVILLPLVLSFQVGFHYTIVLISFGSDSCGKEGFHSAHVLH